MPNDPKPDEQDETDLTDQVPDTIGTRTLADLQRAMDELKEKRKKEN